MLRPIDYEILNFFYDVSDYLSDYEDVNDGDYGTPLANEAMRLNQRVTQLIDALEDEE